MTPTVLLNAAATLIAQAGSNFSTQEASEQVKRFAQMVQFAALASDEKGRLGYDAIIEMMQSTSTTVGVICVRMNALVNMLPGTVSMPFTTIQAELDLLGTMLQRLAEVAPTDVWKRAST